MSSSNSALSPIGVIVEAVLPGSAEEKAGLHVGDVLLWCADRPLRSPFDWQAGYENRQFDAVCVVKLRRGSQALEVNLPASKSVFLTSPPGLTIRPQLSPEVLSLYQEGEFQEQAKHVEAAISAWQNAAKTAEKSGDKAIVAWFYFRMGEMYAQQNIREQAQAQQERALTFLKDDSDLAAQIILRHRLQISLYLQKNFVAATTERQKAATLDAKGEYNSWLVSDITDMGFLARGQSNFILSAQYFLKAILLRQKLSPDSVDVANLYNVLASVLNDQRQSLKMKASKQIAISLLHKMQDYESKARDIFHERLPDSLEEANIIAQLGVIAEELGDIPQAEKLFTHALTIHQQLEEESLDVAFSCIQLGNLEIEHGTLVEAQKWLRVALGIYQKHMPGSVEEADTLNSLSIAASKMNHLVEAQQNLQQAADIYSKQMPDTEKLTEVLINLANIAIMSDDLNGAQQALEQAQKILHKRAPRSFAMAACLSNMGNIAMKQGNPEEAQTQAGQALELLKSISPFDPTFDPTLRANIQTVLGMAALEQGDAALARKCLQQALEIYRKHAPAQVADALAHLGLIAFVQKQWDEARQKYTEALNIYRTRDLRSPYVINLLNELAMTAAAQENYPEAQRAAQEALDSAHERSPDSTLPAASLVTLGFVAYQQHDLPKAQMYYQQAFNIVHNRMPDSVEEATVAADLGHVLLEQQQFDRALPLLNTSVNLLESNRQRISSPETRALLLQQHSFPFFDLLEVQIKRGDKPHAFETLERARARTLVELLNERNQGTRQHGDADVPPELLRRQQDIARQRIKLAGQRQRLDAIRDKAQFDSLQQKLNQIDTEDREIDAAIRRVSPRFAALQRPQPLSFAEAEQTLDAGTLCLAFAIGNKGSYLFALTKTEIEVYPLAVDRQTLEKEVKEFRDALQADGSSYQSQARLLYRQLLAPAQNRIAAAKRVLLCPDDVLHTLPFSALVTSTSQQPLRYFIEEKPLHVVVSLGLLRELRRSKVIHFGSVFAVADPDTAPRNTPRVSAAQNTSLPADKRIERTLVSLQPYPETRLQITALKQLYGTRLQSFMGAQATIAAVKKYTANATIVHFACHGLLDSQHPLLSALALSPGRDDNGRLYAADILNMHIPADLVMLSACETGLGQQTQFEGVLGLTRALQYAGARSVGTTLWKVDATSATALMKQFYQSYKSNASKDVALQRAQIALLRDAAHPNWQHPFYWAAFQLVGDWKTD